MGSFWEDNYPYSLILTIVSTFLGLLVLAIIIYLIYRTIKARQRAAALNNQVDGGEYGAMGSTEEGERDSGESDTERTPLVSSGEAFVHGARQAAEEVNVGASTSGLPSKHDNKHKEEEKIKPETKTTLKSKSKLSSKTDSKAASKSESKPKSQAKTSSKSQKKEDKKASASEKKKDEKSVSGKEPKKDSKSKEPVGESDAKDKTDSAPVTKDKAQKEDDRGSNKSSSDGKSTSSESTSDSSSHSSKASSKASSRASSKTASPISSKPAEETDKNVQEEQKQGDTSPPKSGEESEVSEVANSKKQIVGGDIAKLFTPERLGDKIPIVEYGKQEWKTDTELGQFMRDSYKDLHVTHRFQFVRWIKTEDYCGLRASIYQCLINRIPFIDNIPTIQDIRKSPLTNDDCEFGFSKWDLPACLKDERLTNTVRLIYAYQHLLDLYKKCYSFDLLSARETYFEDFISRGNVYDYELIESVKIIMLMKAIDVYYQMNPSETRPESGKGQEQEQEQEQEEEEKEPKPLPPLANLIFKREGSKNVENYFKNYLNNYNKGLSQLDMSMLAYSLGITIQVFRVEKFRKQEYLGYFNGEQAFTELYPIIDLITENNHHYNLISRS